MKRSKNVISVLIMLAAFTLGGCSVSDAASHKSSEEQQTQSTDESKGIESSQPESISEPTTSPVPEPTPEKLYYTMDGEEYEVILNMTDFNIYSDFNDLKGCSRKKQRAYECF